MNERNSQNAREIVRMGEIKLHMIFSDTIDVHLSEKHHMGRLSIQQHDIARGLVNAGVHQTEVGNKIYLFK
jgi:hypothetical protein